MKLWKLILLSIAALIVLFGVNLVLFSGVLGGLPDEVTRALESDASVIVSEGRGGSTLTFRPAQGEPDTGLIMYPETRKDIHTYAPIARMIAEQGYQVTLMSRRLEMNLSQSRQDRRIADVMAANPGIATWFIGGHTWGAQTAAAFALAHADMASGVVLWAPRLSEETSLAQSALPVLMVYGTADDENVGLLALNQPLLPPQAEVFPIAGGNRADFAYFGPMSADVGSSISFEAYQTLAAEATTAFMGR